MTPLVKEFVAIDFDSVLIDFIWFDIGTRPNFTFRWSELPGQHLPFEKCAIVGFDGKGDKFGLFAEQIDNTAITLSAWAILPAYVKECTPVFAVVMDEEKGGCYIANVKGEEEITKEHAAPFVGILAEFLRHANPTGYKATAKKNSITNARRAKQGKPPLIYDWHTVEIAPDRQKGESLGGTHASPRKHDRRGHWRTCANGLRVWVRNCTVGDASRGTVFKDYKVKHD